MTQPPPYIRKAAIAIVLEQVLADPEGYLTRTFGLQPRSEHILDLATQLYDIATEEVRP